MAAVTESMNVLLINDMCGFGKVALSAMMPVLSHMGFRLHNLPTALVSNTLNYPLREEDAAHLGRAGFHV